MTPADLLEVCRQRGVVLYAEGGRLRYRALPGLLDGRLRAGLAAHRDALVRELDPPAGARLFFFDAAGRLCGPGDASLWCVEGGVRWSYAAKRPPPPAAPALHPAARLHCPRCVERRPTLTWQTFSDGRRQLRCECGACRRFLGFVTPPPRNPDAVFVVARPAV
jgi:hypothetical protein